MIGARHRLRLLLKLHLFTVWMSEIASLKIPWAQPSWIFDWKPTKRILMISEAFAGMLNGVYLLLWFNVCQRFCAVKYPFRKERHRVINPLIDAEQECLKCGAHQQKWRYSSAHLLYLYHVIFWFPFICKIFLIQILFSFYSPI